MAGGQQFYGVPATQNRRLIENYKFYRTCQPVVLVEFEFLEGGLAGR
jgi:hypothetical protein